MCDAFTIGRLRQARPASDPILARRVLLLALAGTTAALGQNSITNSSDGALAAVVAMGTLLPAKTSTVTSGQVQFRLRADNTRGYNLAAVATFNGGAAGTVNGGSTIAASDIGVGITSIVAQAGVVQPRTDTIAAGFGYDPGTVSAIDGLTPYTNAAGGRATLADLAASRTILTGNRIGTGTHFLTVTMKLGVLPQYFSPSSFSAVITLTISTGP